MTDGKRVDEMRLIHLKEIYQKIYRQTCREVGYDHTDLVNRYSHSHIDQEEYDNLCDALDEVYRAKVCKLSKSVLNDTLIAHKSGQRTIATKTIDSIATELLEREISNI